MCVERGEAKLGFLAAGVAARGSVAGPVNADFTLKELTTAIANEGGIISAGQYVSHVGHHSLSTHARSGKTNGSIRAELRAAASEGPAVKWETPFKQLNLTPRAVERLRRESAIGTCQY